MTLRAFFTLIFTLLLIGCAGPAAQHATQSGRVETSINGVSLSKVKSHLTNMMVDKRYVTAKSDDTVIVFERPIENTMAQFMFSSKLNQAPISRVTYNLMDNGGSVRVVGDFAVISNPGTGFENRYDMNNHRDTIGMQSALTHMKIRLEGKK